MSAAQEPRPARPASPGDGVIVIKYDARRGLLRCDGHAGYAPRGQDIVCAAVSAVLYTLAANLPRRRVRKLELTPGKAHICAKGWRARRAFRFALRGLAAIARSYPACVHVERETKK